MKKKLSLFDLLTQAQQAEGENADLAGIYNHFLVSQANDMRKAIGMQLELLPLCNFNCGFCYIRKSPEELKAAGQRILRFDDWKYYIDECVRLGVDGIAFSGGECTIHPDFVQLYEYAYKKNLQLSIITNGSNITDEIFDLFVKCPPTKINVTLYGMSAETYERTCGNGAAFEKVMRNIDRLITRGFTVILNYTAGKENFSDMDAVLAYARERKLAVFPTDALINSGKCDDETVAQEVVDYKEYKQLETAHLSKVTGVSASDYIDEFFSSFVIPREPDKKGLQCSAGKSMIFINWQGMMVPCISFDKFTFDPRKLGFAECWRQVQEWSDNVPLLDECMKCIFQRKCRLCAAAHYGDTGEFGKVSARFCFKKLYPEQAAKIQARYDEMKANGEIE
ncbi:MAG: radical SAM protein [Clostridia bacterium]|nr:radical SAM protein [Clostridia bacterium]